MKKHGIFHSVGELVMITFRKISLYAKFINIGNNVFSGVDVNIHYCVKVDDNIILAAGTLVNKDMPSNSMVVEPARYFITRGLS